MKDIEVLAPAGSYESLISAVNAGADAVYMGGSRFGARAYADNPEEDMFLKGLEYAHLNGVKVYMTVNTLLKEGEISELIDYVKPYYEAGLDAVIVQDLGVFSLIRRHFPDMELHISTQMSLMGKEEVLKLYELGASRVVPARELSLAEIKEIDESCDIDIECFVHGALCYAYSGQCLISSVIGGRSANRGRCAQTCRLPFDLHRTDDKLNTKEKLNKKSELKLLSCKDLCSLDVLPDMIEAGVDSLKIEGRMKSPRYTAGVVSIWRKYVDLYKKKKREAYKVEDIDRKHLLDLFDRGGQTDGYSHTHNDKDMLVLYEKEDRKSVDEAFFDFLDKNYVEYIKKLPIKASLKIKKSEAMSLQLSVLLKDRSISVIHTGAIPDEAKSRAASKEDISKQILKTGATLYEIEELDIELDEGLFVANKLLNELRREAIEKLNKAILPSRKYREPVETEEDLEDRALDIDTKFHIICEEISQLDAVYEYCKDISPSRHHIDELSFQSDTMKAEHWKSYVDKFKCLGIRVYLHMPHIFRTHAKFYFKKHIKELLESDFDGFVIRSLEEALFLNVLIGDKKDKKYIFDYTLYAFNNESKRMFKKLGADRLSLPLELNLKELKDLGTEGMEMLVYGRIPVMVSAQCLKKTTTGCDKKSETLILKDRYKADMPVKNRCEFCYNTIYNSEIFSSLGLSRQIKKFNLSAMRMWFTTEDKESVKELISSYIRAYIYDENVAEPLKSFTRAHLKRGVE